MSSFCHTDLASLGTSELSHFIRELAALLGKEHMQCVQDQENQNALKAESDLVIGKDLWGRLQDSKNFQLLFFTDWVLLHCCKNLSRNFHITVQEVTDIG